MKALTLTMVVALAGCSGAAGGNGTNGEQGPAGPPGPKGDPGEQGPPGSSGGTGETYTAGSRLSVQITTWQGGDGLTFAARGGFHDSEYGSCQPLFTEDGARRCIPFTGMAPVYLDDACATLAGGVLLLCDVPSPMFLAEPVQDPACPYVYTYRVHPVIAPVMPGAVWNLDANGSCVSSAVLPSPWAYFAVGDPIAPTEFVEIDSTTDP